ncbi:site-specific integrase [Herbaspirillum rubrisubalbicans]|nr:site-specific integrase [Herbaspirillum rubrisubalbicans]
MKHVKFSGKDVPWDFNIFMYRGGAAEHARRVQAAIKDGKLGKPMMERLELVTVLHEHICELTAAGKPRSGTLSIISVIRAFFKFVDEDDLFLTLETLEKCYLEWAASMVHRIRTSRTATKRNRGGTYGFSHSSGHTMASSLGSLIDTIFNRATNILQHTGLRALKRRKSAVGVQAEKQSLSDTFEFGHMLQDICDALTIDVITKAPVPVEIKLRTGKSFVLGNPILDHSIAAGSTISITRQMMASIRIEAELEMFIAQTGINTKQAVDAELRHFFYVSHLDGYQVKDHKNRRGGAVLFEIFKDYKSHFERYLAWRRQFFPESNRLFSFFATRSRGDGFRFTGWRLRNICAELDIPFVGPRMLRNTRVNWLLHESGSPEVTAEMAQHTKETLIQVYHKPSLQRAIAESNNFWAEYDPHADEAHFASKKDNQSPQPAVGPGSCVGEPQKNDDAPSEAPEPDCMKKGGCLWCKSHRDIDIFEYVWSLATFRHLKMIEISKATLYIQKADKPVAARLTLEKIDSRLKWFEDSNKTRKEWVDEANVLVGAGEYHPDYRDLIDFLEGRR